VERGIHTINVVEYHIGYIKPAARHPPSSPPSRIQILSRDLSQARGWALSVEAGTIVNRLTRSVREDPRRGGVSEGACSSRFRSRTCCVSATEGYGAGGACDGVTWKGLVDGDLKLSNVLLTACKGCELIVFGSARAHLCRPGCRSQCMIRRRESTRARPDGVEFQ
jgi:hypothetical protein